MKSLVPRVRRPRRIDRLGEARPTRARVELVARAEERLARATSTYSPAWWLSQYSLRNGASVPSCWVTWYCCGRESLELVVVRSGVGLRHGSSGRGGCLVVCRGRTPARARPVTASSSNLDGVEMRIRSLPATRIRAFGSRNRRGSHEVARVQRGDGLGLAGGEAQPGKAGPPAVVHSRWSAWTASTPARLRPAPRPGREQHERVEHVSETRRRPERAVPFPAGGCRDGRAGRARRPRGAPGAPARRDVRASSWRTSCAMRRVTASGAWRSRNARSDTNVPSPITDRRNADTAKSGSSRSVCSEARPPTLDSPSAPPPSVARRVKRRRAAPRRRSSPRAPAAPRGSADAPARETWRHHQRGLLVLDQERHNLDDGILHCALRQRRRPVDRGLRVPLRRGGLRVDARGAFGPQVVAAIETERRSRATRLDPCAARGQPPARRRPLGDRIWRGGIDAARPFRPIQCADGAGPRSTTQPSPAPPRTAWPWARHHAAR